MYIRATWVNATMAAAVSESGRVTPQSLCALEMDDRALAGRVRRAR
jgi:hypothetical protein